MGVALGERELARDLSLLEAVTIGIGGVIGGGVYSVLGIALNMAGPAVIFSFLFCAFTALTVGYNYAKLGRRFPYSGASYEYVARAFPKLPVIKVLLGFLLWFGYIVASGFYSVSFGLYASHFFPWLPSKLFSIILVLSFLSLNLAGVGKTGKTQDIIVLAKVGILGVFVAISLPSVKLTYFNYLFPNGVLGVFSASTLLFIGYEGFEIIGTSGEELENPKRNLSRAIYLTVGVASALYLAVGFVAAGLTPYYSLRDSKAPLAELASLLLGRMGSAILGFGALLSTSSALNAALFGSSRLAYAMAREGTMPSVFSSLSKRTKTPYVGLIVASGMIGIFALIGVVKTLSALASLVFLLVFFTVSLSNLKLRNLTGSSIVFPCLAIGLCVYFMLFVDVRVWIQLIITASIITALYMALSKVHKRR